MNRRNGRRQKEALFLAAIDDWSFDFAFGLMPRSADPYLDRRAIALRGHLVETPRRNVQLTEVLVSSDRFLDDVEARNARPKSAVGFFQVSKGNMRVNLHCPALAIGPIVTALASDRIRCVRFLTIDWHLKEGAVTHYSLERFPFDDDGHEIVL